MKTKEQAIEMVRLSSKGQLTIPAQYRRKVHLNLGDYLSIYEIGDRFILLEKAKPSPLQEIAEILSKEAKKNRIKKKDVFKTINQVRKEIYKERYGR